jgi:hypothetical protein
MDGDRTLFIATECIVPGIPGGRNVGRGSCNPGDNVFEGETCTYVCATGYAARAGTSGEFTCNVGAGFPNITCDCMCGRGGKPLVRMLIH